MLMLKLNDKNIPSHLQLKHASDSRNMPTDSYFFRGKYLLFQIPCNQDAETLKKTVESCNLIHNFLYININRKIINNQEITLWNFIECL